ncbi:MAG: hypothetical protein HEQ39_18415 [Rhizobacter sp.]
MLARRLCVVVFDESDDALRVDGINRPLQHLWALASDALQPDNPKQASPQWEMH